MKTEPRLPVSDWRDMSVVVLRALYAVTCVVTVVTRWHVSACPRFSHTVSGVGTVRGVTVSLAGEWVPPYTVNGWPSVQVLGFPLE